MEELIQWLEAGASADYHAGIRLLEKHSKNRTLSHHLARKDSPANRDKLRYELLKAGLNGDLSAVAEATQLLAATAQHAAAATSELAAAVVVPALEPSPAPAAEQIPDAVRAKVEDISARMSTLWQERCQLSNQLDAASDEQGKVLVADIVKRQEQYNALAERRRQLLAGEATGQPEAPAPGQQAPAPVEPEASAASSTPAALAADVLALGDELRNIRSRLSKARRKLAGKPDDRELETKVQKLELERDQLELQLKKATE